VKPNKILHLKRRVMLSNVIKNRQCYILNTQIPLNFFGFRNISQKFHIRARLQQCMRFKLCFVINDQNFVLEHIQRLQTRVTTMLQSIEFWTLSINTCKFATIIATPIVSKWTNNHQDITMDECWVNRKHLSIGL